MDYAAEAKRVVEIEARALRQLKAQIDETFAQAVEILRDALSRGGKIVVVGVGKSGLIGRKIAATLTSTGATAVVLDPMNAGHGDLGLLSDGDVVLALSYSGESEELVGLLPALRRFQVILISITGNVRSTLARHSDLALNARTPREACPFNLAPTASTTAMLALGDALAMVLLKARGFRRQDFAKYHPAGAIGRALLLRARDVMRTGERRAVADRQTPVREALLLMTRAKAGCVAVVSPRGKLLGVFTDGDLRRRLADDPQALERPLKEVMTPRPVTIREDALAVEALRLFHSRNIDDLIVVNRAREPVGVIDSQDLPKLKLM